MKITVLMENTLEPGLALTAKHGLSLYIETEKQKLLFDTGPDGSFLQNARNLGVDLSQVGIAVISHAHYDHGGGLEEFLRINSQAQVFLSLKAREEYYAQRSTGEFQYIGLKHEVLNTEVNRINYIEELTEITPGISLMPVSEHSTFKPSALHYLKNDGNPVLDRYDHELIMTMEEPDKLHVFTGCSHSGIINMVISVQKQFPGRKIDSVTGGFHLMNTTTGELGEDAAVVRGIAADLLKLDIGKIFTGHCTGSEALSILQEVLKERIEGLSTGKTVTIK